MIDERVRATAEEIALPPGDVLAVKERAVRRRRSRRTMGSLAAAVVVVAAGIALVDEASEQTVVAEQPDVEVVESPLDWRVVEPAQAEVDPGYVHQQPQAEAHVDGAAFRLANPPGEPYEREGQRLYRSVDGAAWDEVGLPEELVPRSLVAAPGNRLVVLGMTRGEDEGVYRLAVAATDDGGRRWEEVDSASLRLDPRAERHRDRLAIDVRAGAWGPAGLAAVIHVSVDPRLERFLDEEALDAGWRTAADGIHVLADGETEPGVGVDVDFTWEELGIAPDLVPFVDGKSYLADLDGGAAADRGPLVLPFELGAHVTAMVGDDSGYHLVTKTYGKVDPDGDVERTVPGRVFHSADARTLAPGPRFEFHGFLFSAGVLDGRAALGVQDVNGDGGYVHLAEASGWRTIDLLDPVGLSERDGSVSEVRFGPSGVAAMVSRWGDRQRHLVHSPEGRTFSAVSLDEHPSLAGRRDGLATIGMAGEAIAVSVTGQLEDDGAPPTVEVILMGTPPG